MCETHFLHCDLCNKVQFSLASLWFYFLLLIQFHHSPHLSATHLVCVCVRVVFHLVRFIHFNRHRFAFCLFYLPQCCAFWSTLHQSVTKVHKPHKCNKTQHLLCCAACHAHSCSHTMYHSNIGSLGNFYILPLTGKSRTGTDSLERYSEFI